MQAVIKSISSSDVVNLESWKPKRLEDIYFPLELTIGLPDQEGGELFQILVTSPEAIRTHQDPDLGDIFFARHYMIVFEYVWAEILAKLVQLPGKPYRVMVCSRAYPTARCVR